MASRPFAFYRGTNRLFWQDLAADDRLTHPGDFDTNKSRTWLAGDAHIANLGAFADSREKVVYGLNDFDEAIIGDYRYDFVAHSDQHRACRTSAGYGASRTGHDKRVRCGLSRRACRAVTYARLWSSSGSRSTVGEGARHPASAW